MRRFPPAVLALVLPLLACDSVAPPPSGAALYQRYCASCHGANGLGDGPAAGAMAPPPSNLAAGRRSVPDLMQVIDGRRSVRAHGTSAMPVWGEVFEQMHLDDAHAKRIALLQVEALADYVSRLAGGGTPASP
jgi:mono/diheme cytochrome c family protein